MTARLEPKRVKGKASCRPIQKELNDNPYHRISSHFDYNSALKDFTISQGKQWNGGETLSDQCM